MPLLKHLRLASLALTLLHAAAAQQPLSPATPPSLPPGVVEQPITFPAAEALTLPGTLTLPAPDPAHPHGKPPLAILEQGSGVQDRDATLGPNKLFQQLAWGLAARGIATLRYDRRPKVDPASFTAHPDLDHELVLDAVAALAWAATDPKLTAQTDPHRLFLIGHSLGAQLAPDIVAARLRQAPGSVAGLALLAPIARPIDQVMHAQMASLGAAQGGSPAQIADLQARYDTLWARVRNPETPASAPGGLGGGVTVGYLRDWLARDPAATLKTLHLPAFLARGEKDLNTTPQDLTLLQAVASPGSQTLTLPNLSHEFMPIPGPPNGREALQPGTLSPTLLDPLAHWLLHVPPSPH